MNKSNRPLLSWRLTDYKKNNIEPPEELSDYPEKTEGELMNEEEIQGWYQASYKTLIILKDTDYNVFLEIRENFLKDLGYLEKLKKISEEIIENTLEDELFKQ